MLILVVLIPITNTMDMLNTNTTKSLFNFDIVFELKFAYSLHWQ